MAIVKMKRLQLVAMRADQGELLKKLRRLGCVEIDPADPDTPCGVPPDPQRLDAATAQADQLQAALDILKRDAPAKEKLLKPRPTVGESRFFDDALYQSALDEAQAIVRARQDINALQAKRTKLETQRAGLAPWLDLGVSLDLSGTRETVLLFGTIPLRVERLALSDRLDEATDLYHISWAGEDREFRYLMLLVHRSALEAVQAVLPEVGFNRLNLQDWSGAALQNHRRLEAELAGLEQDLAQAWQTLRDKAGLRDDLRLALDRARQEVALEQARMRLLDTQSAFFLDGWFPAEQEGKVTALLSGCAAYEIRDPAPEEYPKTPVKLKNRPLSTPMNMVTEMYSLPAYGGVDPNPLMAPFFILFYGIMMADMAYGLIMMLASLIVLKKAKPQGTMKYMFSLMGLCGVTTFLMGAMTGGFFGDMIPQIFKMSAPQLLSTLKPAIGSTEPVWFWPPLFTPLNNTLEILIGAMVLGFIQVITGMVISFVKQTKDGQFLSALLNEGAWWVIFAGVALFLFGVGNPGGVPVVLLVGFAMLVAGCFRKKPGIGALGSLLGAIYNGVTGIFQDVLSYSRLMALMLSGSIIASVFNTLGTVTGNVFTFVLISLFGNALNFTLNILGCFVHDLRLQCLEFFGRFYADGGKPFKPLAVNPKYVNLVKEEQ